MHRFISKYFSFVIVIVGLDQGYLHQLVLIAHWLLSAVKVVFVLGGNGFFFLRKLLSAFRCRVLL
ncbi:hypothetical protein Slin_4007 [Spirosoma linguale DSM 74]|uniref:Uncharacterized protein n=1 Tax=Spirosoma linguale (strain ATCC 33905 / DSM 74 / LMG 10896 / Claus 1) TaxID=504472 RepID=D2QIS1_SPILD|nr:hypothetical protein Slin_4007 [Spirosoma linguale DSM 74]